MEFVKQTRKRGLLMCIIITLFLRKDTKRVIRSRKSKKDRKCNGQEKKDRKTDNDLQNTKQYGQRCIKLCIV
jgi:hypothetical protein